MATYVEILKSEFPEIDSELFDYITGERPGSEPPCAGLRAAVCRAQSRRPPGERAVVCRLSGLHAGL